MGEAEVRSRTLDPLDIVFSTTDVVPTAYVAARNAGYHRQLRALTKRRMSRLFARV